MYDDANHTVRREFCQLQAGGNSDTSPSTRVLLASVVKKISVLVVTQATADYGVKLYVDGVAAASCPVPATAVAGTILDFDVNVSVPAMGGFCIMRFNESTPDDTFNADVIAVYYEVAP